MNFKKNILITGGAGFIGSHLVKFFVNKYPQYRIINFDKLSYAGNLSNLKEIENKKNYVFIKGDITKEKDLIYTFKKFNIDSVINLAAESHVDRSIFSPKDFVTTNILGTVNLLNICLKKWDKNFNEKIFYQISTDEVYGSLGKKGYFTENSCYKPRSPYSASKAGADHLIRAYFHTYKLPIIISNCCNNYGPNQFPEKLIPLCINNIKNNIPIPVYGKGENIRDWLFVEDHVRAIDIIFHKGKIGETYNVGANNEWKNIDLIKLICKLMDKKLGRKEGESEKLITYVKDRAGHDFRYAIDSSKLKNNLKWEPKIKNFEQGLSLTIDWYLNNESWLNNIISGEYKKYYEKQYGNK